MFNDESSNSTRVIGIMDPNSFSFRAALEGLLSYYLQKPVEYKDEAFNVEHRRIMCRPYNTLGAKTSCDAILNRGAHWSPHYNSFFMMVSPKTYLLNDMLSFKSIDKNSSYGQMHDLGLNIPKTWAIPQEDYSELKNSERIEPDLIFPEYEMFDLKEIGDEVGYPAFLKPQSGGGWVGVERVNSFEDLLEAYRKSEDKPMNLQAAVPFTEFVRTVGVGPQMYPMHYNPDSKYSHDRYLRNEHQAIEHNFITPEQRKEVSQITKIINAFYNWDHNSCEALISSEDNLIYPIDFANAYPDSHVTSLHYFFPDVVKGMAKWLIYNAITKRQKPVFSSDWHKYYEVLDQAQKENWTYEQKLDAYEKVADEHFTTKEFNGFCETSLVDFDKKALEFFDSEEFHAIVEEAVRRYFKVADEVPQKIAHYAGILNFWVECERNRLEA